MAKKTKKKKAAVKVRPAKKKAAMKKGSAKKDGAFIAGCD
jgi:hypothetical protein